MPELSALTSTAALTNALIAAVPASSAASPAVAPIAASPHASPVSLLDPRTGLVVLEFFDAKGDETASLPTKHQLDLYRRNEPSLDIFQPAIRDDSVPSPKVASAGVTRQV